MPIKDKSIYPDNWKELRNEILVRAGGKMPDPRAGARCEICGVRNYSIGHRDGYSCFWEYREQDSANQKYVDDLNDLKPVKMESRGFKYIQIILTTMHLDHDTKNNSLDNLKAGCQQCHNAYDVPFRKANRAETRRNKMGQLTLDL